jgi:enoyl-CoA hydratase/carnithine racemase
MPEADDCCNARICCWSWDDYDSPSSYQVGIRSFRGGFLTGPPLTFPRIAYEGGKYGFVFARRGITMESSSSFFLPRLIGYSRAMYLVTTGGVYPPTSKHFGHLFAETLPEASQVLPRALELAAEIAENVSPLASYLNRELMWRNPGSAEGTHLVDSAVLYHMFDAKYVEPS